MSAEHLPILPNDSAHTGTVVLVTGASGGIGLAVVQQLLAAGYHVVATALPMSVEVIPEQVRSHPRCAIVAADLRSLESINAVAQQACSIWGRVDVLVNNAGFSFRGVVEHMSVDEELEQFAVNYFAAMELTRCLLPHFRQRGSGRIINVSSVSGMMAMPTMSSYSASKWALEGGSEALWYEMRPLGISVTLVQPGFVNSEAFRKVRLPRRATTSAEPMDVYRAYYRYMSRFVNWLMQHTLATNTSVAKAIVRVVASSRPPLRVQATLDAWIFHALRRFLPRRLYHPLLYALLPGVRQWGKKE